MAEHFRRLRAYGERRGNMAFAEIEISRGVLARICWLSRLESCCYSIPVSLPSSVCLYPLLHSLSPRHFSHHSSPPLRLLLSDRREPRDTNQVSKCLSLSISIFFSLSFTPSLQHPSLLIKGLAFALHCFRTAVSFSHSVTSSEIIRLRKLAELLNTGAE